MYCEVQFTATCITPRATNSTEMARILQLGLSTIDRLNLTNICMVAIDTLTILIDNFIILPNTFNESECLISRLMLTREYVHIVYSPLLHGQSCDTAMYL